MINSNTNRPCAKLIAHTSNIQRQYRPTNRLKKTTMIAQILRYLAACLTAAADWIAPPPTIASSPTKKGMAATAHGCRERKNDIFLTPTEVAKHHIKSAMGCWIATSPEMVDPFRNTGVYYDNFPDGCEKDWCEILRGRDALKYDYNGKVVCSNPPYSLITPMLERMVETRAEGISLLIGCLNVTVPRLNKMREAGYTITDVQLYNIKGYMGTSFAITWMRTEGDDVIGVNYEKGGYKVDQSAAIRE